MNGNLLTTLTPSVHAEALNQSACVKKSGDVLEVVWDRHQDKWTVVIFMLRTSFTSSKNARAETRCTEGAVPLLQTTQLKLEMLLGCTSAVVFHKLSATRTARPLPGPRVVSLPRLPVLWGNVLDNVLLSMKTLHMEATTLPTLAFALLAQ